MTPRIPAKRKFSMTEAQVIEHQSRHGFILRDTMRTVEAPGAARKAKEVKPRQNATEREYGLILEAMKRRGEILDYRPFGMRLEWGADPQTGKPMVYSPDFIVWRPNPSVTSALDAGIVLHECKGNYIYPKDLIRFKGCRAEWPMFRFELHQKTAEGWRQLF